MINAELIYFVYYTLLIHDLIIFIVYLFYKFFKEK